MTLTPLYPLLTERRVVEPLWGGTRLARWLNLPEPHPERIGETWQVYDSNPVINGPLAGWTLADVTSTYGAALVGTRAVEMYGNDFPLLAKFIDAAQPLSIQVHPDDEYAHEHEAGSGFHGKTEAWYILDAEPGASVVYGLKQPTERTDFAAAVESGEVEALLHRLPVRKGDVIFVPAGTIHAIDAGITLFEIQQKSDLTYRVYDYGRVDARTGEPRKLHIERALDVSDLEPAPRGTVPPLDLDETRTLLVACRYFALERWVPDGPMSHVTSPGTFEILTVIGGGARLHAEQGDLGLARGESLLLPATLGNYTLEPEVGTSEKEPLELLRAYVPDLEVDIITLLEASGVDRARIAETVAI